MSSDSKITDPSGIPWSERMKHLLDPDPKAAEEKLKRIVDVLHDRLMNDSAKIVLINRVIYGERWGRGGQ